jgi:hypothetical protein
VTDSAGPTDVADDSLVVGIFDPDQAEAEAADLDDTVARLLADTPEDTSVPPLDMAGLAKLQRLKAAKARYEAMAKTLGKAIDAMEVELVDNVLPHRSTDGRWSATVGDHTGYLNTRLWPKRRTDESTGEPYTTEDLVSALRADAVDSLIAQSVNGQTLAAWLRERVERWDQVVSESGYRNECGELTDLDGQVLDKIEAADPTDPDLALPRHVRKILTVTAQMKISYRQR